MVGANRRKPCRLTPGLLARHWAESVAAALLLVAFASSGEEKLDTLTLDTLRIGNVTYSNVTVYSTNRTDVFIKCAGGVANIKVRDLSPEDLRRLGYYVPEPKTNPALAVVQRLQTDPRIKEVQERVAREVSTNVQGIVQRFDPKVLWGVAAGAVLLWLFFCYCCMLICQKTGFEPGGLVWLPILQAFPMLKAAGMPAWWFLWFLLPVVNVIAGVVWCVKIAKARKKTFLTALMLMLPGPNFLAFLYLAFSGDGEVSSPKRITLNY